LRSKRLLQNPHSPSPSLILTTIRAPDRGKKKKKKGEIVPSSSSFVFGGGKRKRGERSQAIWAIYWEKGRENSPRSSLGRWITAQERGITKHRKKPFDLGYRRKKKRMKLFYNPQGKKKRGGGGRHHRSLSPHSCAMERKEEKVGLMKKKRRGGSPRGSYPLSPFSTTLLWTYD